MFELIRNNTKALMFVLVVLIIPSFVFLGVEGYSGFSEGNVEVAEVAGQPITQAQWDAAHRAQIERMRSQAPDIDIGLLDTPQMKQQTLEGLVRERVVRVAANDLHLGVSDERLQRIFVNDPQFAFLRKPDGSIDTELLNAQGLSAEQFAQQLRQDVAMRQVLLGVADTALGASTPTSTALDALLQRREVRIARFEAKNYVDQVKPTEAEIATYYNDPARADAFMAPERAKVEYVVLDLDALAQDISVSEEELRKYYAENAARFSTPEERRASHILVKAGREAPAAEREKAGAEAAALQAEAKKNPDSFAELAKKNSDDPGSAAQGGDLDFFARGAMTQPFEEAAFAMKTGEISDVVESDFGYHVIKLTGVRGGGKKSFEEARAEIEAEVKQQLAQQKFAEAAEMFSNMVYEQSDSLQPAAEKLGLKVRSAEGITRMPGQGADGVLASQSFLTALFSDDALRNKRNTEAVETGPNQLTSGRVVEHTPARKLPLDAVEDQIRQQIVADRSAALARKEGEAKLAAWKGGAPAEAFEPPITISREQSRTLPRSLIEAVMSASAASLPAWTGVDFDEEGYAVVRIDKLVPRDPSQEDRQQLQQQYAQLWGAAEAEAYYASLRKRYKAEVTGTATAAGNAP
ncbi:SurA N-terminal domain-containing protein [Methylibium sp.]|uniref:SurA N-terminal domain-containing protein n=1 Tax=Methylibium sp. TaxID=2067992 RepID=UPI0017927510|nr:SurA N-terminal domain-containing protein [Methylibium sp.]MBA3591865.1 SurA N-terminal domain-containing protein [Methylibium sp.]